MARTRTSALAPAREKTGSNSNPVQKSENVRVDFPLREDVLLCRT
jgi:hypothetical protein